MRRGRRGRGGRTSRRKARAHLFGGHGLPSEPFIRSVNLSPWQTVTYQFTVDVKTPTPVGFNVNQLANLFRDDIGLVSNAANPSASRIPIALRFVSSRLWVVSPQYSPIPHAIKGCFFSLVGNVYWATRTGWQSIGRTANVGYVWPIKDQTTAFNHDSTDKVLSVAAGPKDTVVLVQITVLWRPTLNANPDSFEAVFGPPHDAEVHAVSRRMFSELGDDFEQLSI